MKVRFGFFPGNKKRALTMSYDDGVVQDRRLIEIFNKYGIKGSFHLNSANLGREGHIDASEVATLYAGHEVSVHSLTHPFLERIPPMELVHEIMEDRKNLESLCGYIVRGMSYPFGTYSSEVLDQLKNLGIVCSRTVKSTGRFTVPENFLEWHPTCHHRENIMEKLEKFKANRYSFGLFYVWGHAYELDQEIENNNWQMIEEFCAAASNDPDTWYATNIEIYDYVTALRRVVLSADCTLAYNPSAIDVILDVDGAPVTVPAGQTVKLG
ncbi:MAG: polysaccharide deacetylase family protein [Clostridia bacterium]|nr:polysaccharide deacetylase family protein [Clostridia bacterium]